jgi:hypothetical protein
MNYVLQLMSMKVDPVVFSYQYTKKLKIKLYPYLLLV